MYHVTIVEGPDGSGKSTYAAELARKTDALLVHCGPFLKANSDELCRIYCDAMAPAMFGHVDVVMDRCWLSEPIYGAVFRGGTDRVGRTQREMLEKIARGCDATVVVCLPPIEVCLATFRKRKGVEYLEKEEQLIAVHDRYHSVQTSLPVMYHDYTNGGLQS